jgi:hypothetical protein
MSIALPLEALNCIFKARPLILIVLPLLESQVISSASIVRSIVAALDVFSAIFSPFMVFLLVIEASLLASELLNYRHFNGYFHNFGIDKIRFIT